MLCESPERLRLYSVDVASSPTAFCYVRRRVFSVPSTSFLGIFDIIQQRGDLHARRVLLVHTINRHLSQLLHCCGSDCQYCVRDFLRLYQSLVEVVLPPTAVQHSDKILERKHRVITKRERSGTRYCMRPGILRGPATNYCCIAVVWTAEICARDSQSYTALG